MKQILRILQIAAVFALFSCSKMGVSETEVKAVDKVLDFYSGKIERLKSFNLVNGKNTAYFELKISGSRLLNLDQKNLTEHAGNIAYLFYSNLKDEKSEYDAIKVTIELANEETRNYAFPISELKEIEKLYPEVEKTNSSIKNADYKSLAAQTQDKNTNVNENENDLKKLFEELHARFGSIKEIQHQGWSFQNDSRNGDYILIREAVLFDKTSGSMYLSYARKTKQLLDISFR